MTPIRTHPPEPVLQAIQASLPPGDPIRDVVTAAGGDINEAGHVRTDSGARYFLKWNRAAPPGLFEAEADGLDALGAAADDHLIVPSVHATGEVAGVAWLLMEHIDAESDGAAPDWATGLARGLAELHRRGAGALRAEWGDTGEAPAYGWGRDNFIGRLPQANAGSDDWAAFWRDRRLAPQVGRAAESGALSGAGLEEIERLLTRLDDVLPGAPAPSLLHGDLWGGNVMKARDGRAAIYDPAVYVGHREVDLAMSELFGFPAGFMSAYRECWPLEPEYDEFRRDVYQLYYLLVHVNLFGGGYVAPARAAVRRVLGAI